MLCACLAEQRVHHSSDKIIVGWLARRQNIGHLPPWAPAPPPVLILTPTLIILTVTPNHDSMTLNRKGLFTAHELN